MEIYFVNKVYLSLLFLIPLMVLIHFIAIKLTKKTALKFSNFDAIAKIKGVDFYSKNITILLLSSIIIIFLIFSLSGLTIKIQREASDFSFIVAVDSSESMSAKDFSPNRLEAAKLAALKFVDSSPHGTKIGVISFSGNAIVEEKGSSEKEIVRRAVEKIELTSIGGTDISEVIVTSINQLYDEKSKAIIILSDGQINTGSLDEAVEYANRNDVVIHTIGIGTLEGGMTSYGLSKLDSDSLKSLAYNTKGIYTEALNNQQLDESFNSIMQFKMKDVPYNTSKTLLIISIILFFIEFILINTKYKSYP